MTEKKPITQGITKTETKRGISGSIMEEKSMSVYGNDLKECTKILREEWDK